MDGGVVQRFRNFGYISNKVSCTAKSRMSMECGAGEAKEGGCAKFKSPKLMSGPEVHVETKCPSEYAVLFGHT